MAAAHRREKRPDTPCLPRLPCEMRSIGKPRHEAAALVFVRPAGRTHLEVKVLYTPGKGKC